MEIRIAYDNTSANGDVVEDWGFGAVVTAGSRRVLFDSGADPDLFLKNLEKLSVEPSTISHALISHHHSDHRGGIYRLALKNSAMRVFFLDSFPGDAFEVAMAVGMTPERVNGPAELAPGIYTTGEVSGQIPEQALIVETSDGPVVLVGCSHPGVVRMVEAVKQQRKASSIRLLLGGFHMMRQEEAEIQTQVEQLQKLGVRQIAPAHCTGEKAKRMFRAAWGEDYLASGAGRIILLD